MLHQNLAFRYRVKRGGDICPNPLANHSTFQGKYLRLLDPGIGGEKLHFMYHERFGPDYEYMVGRDKMEAIIARNGLNVRLPRRRPRTTDSTHGLPTYPNLAKDIIPIRKNQIWATDITGDTSDSTCFTMCDELNEN